jgi:hypothetical protein
VYLAWRHWDLKSYWRLELELTDWVSRNRPECIRDATLRIRSHFRYRLTDVSGKVLRSVIASRHQVPLREESESARVHRLSGIGYLAHGGC